MCPREKIKACRKGRTSKGSDVKKVALEEECKDALGKSSYLRIPRPGLLSNQNNHATHKLLKTS